MRLCRPARGSTIVFDLGTGLRYFGKTQPVDGSFRGSCLLSHLHWDHTQGSAVLRADPATGVAPRRVRAGPGGRPAVGRRDPRLHAATALPDLARRPAGDGGLPRRRRHGVRDRRCSSPVAPLASRGQHARLPPHLRGHVDRLHLRSPAAVRRHAFDVGRGSRARAVGGSAHPRLPVHDGGVPREAELGSLHRRVRAVAGRRMRRQAACSVPSRSQPHRRRHRRTGARVRPSPAGFAASMCSLPPKV